MAGPRSGARDEHAPFPDAAAVPGHDTQPEPAWYAEYKQSLDPLDQLGAAPDDSEGGLLAPEALEEVSFVRRARQRAFWERPLVQGLLALLALALLLLLAAQVGMHERDRLAALSPRLRPYLERICAPLGCQLQAPRQIESIVIDSSSLNRLRPDAFQLGLTLRNQAGIAVAMPWLELTLTDTGEQPLLRRVLSPAELGAPPVLAAAGDWSTALTLTIGAEAGGGRVAGYRLLAFYP